MSLAQHIKNICLLMAGFMWVSVGVYITQLFRDPCAFCHLYVALWLSWHYSAAKGKQEKDRVHPLAYAHITSSHILFENLAVGHSSSDAAGK